MQTTSANEGDLIIIIITGSAKMQRTWREQIKPSFRASRGIVEKYRSVVSGPDFNYRGHFRRWVLHGVPG